MASAELKAGTAFPTEAEGAIGIAHQIPRNTLALLMVAQVAVIFPYLQQLSVWIIAVGLGVAMGLLRR